jgi:hypothetical protein
MSTPTLREAAQAVVNWDDGGNYLARTDGARSAIDFLRDALAAEPTPAPPQAPMSEDMIKVLIQQHPTMFASQLIEFARAVERHHGIGTARGEPLP